jgi:sulfur carrier protein
VIHVNGADSEHHGETVGALLERLGVVPRGVAVALDGEVVPRSRWDETMVPDGASIEIVTAVAGG